MHKIYLSTWPFTHITRTKGTPSLRVLFLFEDVGQAAFTAVLAVVMPCHKDAGTASRGGALATETGDLARLVDLVVLEDSQLDLLLLVTDLLGGSVCLLLALLATAEQFNVEVKGSLGHHVVEGESVVILHGLAAITETLQVGGNVLASLDSGFDGGDGSVLVGINDQGFTRKGADENLHFLLLFVFG